MAKSDLEMRVAVKVSEFTEDEEAVLQLLGKAWEAFRRVPVLHPDDETEFRHAIHAAQNIVLARAALFDPIHRQYPQEGSDARTGE